MPMSYEADNAARDCSAVMAIFADRWRNAEHYRDCLEILARAESRRLSSGMSATIGSLQLDVAERRELGALTEKLVRMGIHRHVAQMLREMSEVEEEI